MLVVVIGTALLAGYLLIRDVHREADTSALRSHFVASVSHELKTPLTSIRAHAETLMMGRASTPEITLVTEPVPVINNTMPTPVIATVGSSTASISTSCARRSWMLAGGKRTTRRL